MGLTCHSNNAVFICLHDFFRVWSETNVNLHLYFLGYELFSPTFGQIQTDRWQTDGKRCIWAHSAICTGGLQNGNSNKISRFEAIWHTRPQAVDLQHVRFRATNFSRVGRPGNKWELFYLNRSIHHAKNQPTMALFTNTKSLKQQL